MEGASLSESYSPSLVCAEGDEVVAQAGWIEAVRVSQVWKGRGVLDGPFEEDVQEPGEEAAGPEGGFAEDIAAGRGSFLRDELRILGWRVLHQYQSPFVFK